MLHPAYIPQIKKTTELSWTLNITGSGINMAANSFFYFSINKKISLVHLTLHRLCIKYIYVCMYLLVYVYACVYECTY